MTSSHAHRLDPVVTDEARREGVRPAPELATDTAALSSQPSPAQLIALQRSAGNSAVTRMVRDLVPPARSGARQLQRAPDPVAAKPDELLTVVLRGAAFRADEAHS